MKLTDLRRLVKDLVGIQEEIVRNHGQSLAESELENQFENLNDAEIQEDFMTSRMGYQREAGYLEALKFIQTELEGIDN